VLVSRNLGHVQPGIIGKGTWMEDMTQQQKPQSDCPPQCPYQAPDLAAADDEIDLIELWRVVWAGRKLILAMTFCAALAAIGFSLRMPDIYHAEVLLAPIGNEGSKGGLSSLGGLGGLAAMAGVSMPGGGDVETNLAVLRSREFLTQFVKDKALMPILFADGWDPQKKGWKEVDPEEQPGPWDAYRLLTGSVMQASQDKKTSLVTVSAEWTDPALAADWANALVARLNDYLRQQAIVRSENNLKYLNQALETVRVIDMRRTLYSLISDEQNKAMLANTQEEYAFRIIDQASVPDQKSKPKRSMIVILATMTGGMLAIFSVFFLHWLRRQKEVSAA